jgi:hypothetical protein
VAFRAIIALIKLQCLVFKTVEFDYSFLQCHFLFMQPDQASFIQRELKPTLGHDIDWAEATMKFRIKKAKTQFQDIKNEKRRN